MIGDETERELQNWALWHGNGGWPSVRGSTAMSAVCMGSQGGYREAPVPILSGAANDVDDIVTALPVEVKCALRIWYLRLDPNGRYLPPRYTQYDMAKRLDCSERTFKTRLDVGRKAVAEGLLALRRRTDAMRPVRGP